MPLSDDDLDFADDEAADDRRDTRRNTRVLVGILLPVLIAVFAFTALSPSDGLDGDDSTVEPTDPPTSDPSVTAPVDPKNFRPVTVDGAAIVPPPDPWPATFAEDPAVGLPAPTIVGESFDGDRVAIEPGTPTIIVGVSHWCPHCQPEMPRVVDWIRDGTIPSDIAVIALVIGTDPTRPNFPPEQWLDELRWKSDVLVDDQLSTASAALSLFTYPMFVGIDRDGRITGRLSGEATEAEVTRLVEVTLAGSPPGR